MPAESGLDFAVVVKCAGFDRFHGGGRLRGNLRWFRTRANTRLGDAEVTVSFGRRGDGFRRAVIPMESR